MRKVSVVTWQTAYLPRRQDLQEHSFLVRCSCNHVWTFWRVVGVNRRIALFLAPVISEMELRVCYVWFRFISFHFVLFCFISLHSKSWKTGFRKTRFLKKLIDTIRYDSMHRCRYDLQRTGASRCDPTRPDTIRSELVLISIAINTIYWESSVWKTSFSSLGLKYLAWATYGL